MFEPFMELIHEAAIKRSVETIPESLAMMISTLLAENRRLSDDLSRYKEKTQGLKEQLKQKDETQYRLIDERNTLQRELRELQEKRQKRRKRK